MARIPDHGNELLHGWKNKMIKYCLLYIAKHNPCAFRSIKIRPHIIKPRGVRRCSTSKRQKDANTSCCSLRTPAVLLSSLSMQLFFLVLCPSSCVSHVKAATLPSVGEGGGGSGCVSNLVFSAIILWKPIPTPSMTASKIAQPIAPFLTALGPPRTASAPPVKNPAIMAFQGSSFLLQIC